MKPTYRSVKTHEAMRLCDPEYPIMQEGHNLHYEYCLLTKPRNQPYKHATSYYMKTPHYWKRLATTGEWLYSMVDLLDTNKICDGVSQAKIQPNGTGILSLKSGCVAQTSDISLFGTSMTEISETFIYNFEYPLNLSLFLQRNNFLVDDRGLAILDEESAAQVQTWALTYDVISLEDIERQFHQMITQRRTQDTMKVYIVTGFVGEIVIIIILYILARCYFYKTQNRMIVPLYKKPKSRDFPLERRNPLSRSHRVRSLSTEDETV